jgi:hypothetical protein
MKRSAKSTKSTWRNILLLAVIIVIVIIVLDPNNSRSPTTPPATIVTRPPETSAANMNTAVPTLTLPASATSLPVTPAPAQTLPPLATNRPIATEENAIQVTPIAGLLYDVRRSANALRCPDTRCKVIETYKKDNIVVVTGMVNGTSYKGDKSKVWMQIISHSGTRVYIHASLVTPHES